MMILRNRSCGMLIKLLAFVGAVTGFCLITEVKALVPDAPFSSSRRAFFIAGGTATSAVPLLFRNSNRNDGEPSTMAAAAWAATAAPAASSLPELGLKAPGFELPTSRGDGSTTSLADLTKTGKWTVLYFYPAAFTQGCTLEARNFQKDVDKYKALNAQIVGVSVDQPEKNAQFCSAESLDFYMLSDVGGKVSKQYGTALSIPGFGTFSNRQTYLIDPSGNMRWIFRDVESHIPRHSTEVLEKIDDLRHSKKA